MKNVRKTLLLITLFTFTKQFAQEKPTVQDLDFMIGTWEIQFEIYDTHQPNNKPIFTEKGQQVCGYDLELNDIPMFLTCKGDLVIDWTDEDHKKGLGRKRQIMESIRYGKFENAFERIGLYSNWPATGLETLRYDSTKRQIIIRGQLNVQDNMLERYVDTYQFNEDYSYAQRINIANFSDMPLTEYNLTLKAIYKRVDK